MTVHTENLVYSEHYGVFFNAQKMKIGRTFNWNAETVGSNSLISVKQVMLLEEEEEQKWRSQLKPTVEGHNGHFFGKVNYIGGGGGVCEMSPVIKALERIGRSTTRRRLQTTKKESETTPPKRVLKQPPLVRLNG